mmetsp:Transcript_287/g.708  ORF Transcript_287/g.708 Transcript_287/m.708 type:complete len:512 (-) Transcript_287:178-1713(-)
MKRSSPYAGNGGGSSTMTVPLADDGGAGQHQQQQQQQQQSTPPAPMSRGGMSTMTSASDIEFYEDLISDPVLVLGVDISHLSSGAQFVVCASGVFFFTLLYGYLQELLSVQLCSRKLGLFLAVVQFSGYTFLAYILRTYVYRSQQSRSKTRINALSRSASTVSVASLSSSTSLASTNDSFKSVTTKALVVPFTLYLGLSLLRAVDLACTNIAMQFINYPAKTLIKSSRIVFTMIFGVFITHKKYNVTDYAIVLCMVVGLAIFMHADATSSAVFEPLGVILLMVSLTCDGAITNMSERIMTQYGVGQDEFIFRMYSIALIAIAGAAAVKGDLTEGVIWILQPGTYEQVQNNIPLEERSYSSSSKIILIILFSSMGFFGSSCAAAITKNFGALAMSITSTARKATTLFLSFLLFDNKCTLQHIVGIFVFISALTAKSVRRKNKRRKGKTGDKSARSRSRRKRPTDLEVGVVRSRSSSSNRSEDVPSKDDSRVSRRAAATDRNGSHHRPRYHIV